MADKNDHFQMNNVDNFLTFAQNIYKYVSYRIVSYIVGTRFREYQNFLLKSESKKVRKISFVAVNPSFTI